MPKLFTFHSLFACFQRKASVAQDSLSYFDLLDKLREIQGKLKLFCLLINQLQKISELMSDREDMLKHTNGVCNLDIDKHKKAYIKFSEQFENTHGKIAISYLEISSSDIAVLSLLIDDHLGSINTKISTCLTDFSIIPQAIVEPPDEPVVQKSNPEEKYFTLPGIVEECPSEVISSRFHNRLR